jgi:hypothetical protein
MDQNTDDGTLCGLCPLQILLGMATEHGLMRRRHVLFDCAVRVWSMCAAMCGHALSEMKDLDQGCRINHLDLTSNTAIGYRIVGFVLRQIHVVVLLHLESTAVLEFEVLIRQLGKRRCLSSKC